MDATLSTAAYLGAAILFILSLGGLHRVLLQLVTAGDQVHEHAEVGEDDHEQDPERLAPARQVVAAEDFVAPGAWVSCLVLVEAAWAYQHRPNVSGFLLRRQKNLTIPDEAKKIAWKAQQRLHKRYQAFSARGKNKNQIVTALGRELLGFIWAIARTVTPAHA